MIAKSNIGFRGFTGSINPQDQAQIDRAVEAAEAVESIIQSVTDAEGRVSVDRQAAEVALTSAQQAAIAAEQSVAETIPIAAAAVSAREAAESAAAQAALYDGPRFDRMADLLADTSLTRSPGAPGSVALGQMVQIRGLGTALKVAAPSPGKYQVKTAGDLALEPVDPAYQCYLPHVENVSLPAGYRLIGTADGHLIAALETALFKSLDGEAWTSAGSAGMQAGGSQSRLVQMDNGEVILSSTNGTKLYRSTGWGTPGMTFSEVLAAASYNGTSAYFDRGWGWRVAGRYVIASEYGSPKPRAYRSYLSSDYGQTFEQVWFAPDHFTIPAGANYHNHGCCVDPWHMTAGVPRIWQLSADTGFVGVWYSDDKGANWSRLDGDQFPTYVSVADGVEPCNYLTMNATPSGIILGTDNWPDGTAVIRRDETYAARPKIRTAISFDDEMMLTHIAQMVQTVGDWSFTLMEPVVGLNRPTRIVATNSAIGRGWSIHVSGAPLGVNRLIVQNETIWLTAGDGVTVKKLRLHQTKEVLGDNGAVTDPGRVLGGRSRSDDRNMALGPNAVAGGTASIAAGALTKTTGQQQVGFGNYVKLTGDYAFGYGTGANFGTGGILDAAGASPGVSVNGVRSGGIGVQVTVDGVNCLGIGDRVEVVGTRCVGIGSQVKANGTGALALGDAEALANFGIAIGDNARVTGSEGIAIGPNAEATATSAVGIGTGKANHSRAVAFPGTTSPANEAVTYGLRWFQALRYTSNRSAPPGKCYFVVVARQCGSDRTALPRSVRRRASNGDGACCVICLRELMRATAKGIAAPGA